MPTLAEGKGSVEVPTLPAGTVDGFIPYLTSNKNIPIVQLLEPYKAFEGSLRKLYAQEPEHSLLQDGKVNVVPIFDGHEDEIVVHARDLDKETTAEKEKYIMSLSPEERKKKDEKAVVGSLKEFQTNFNLFSELSLSDLDWNNVVAAGSAVTTSLLPVPAKWNESKRKLREYYHEHLAPASDVDLFLYGLNEEQALEKIEQIERNIKDSILAEVTTIRTKNAITIASAYPIRHVQIVLRLYDSISQILTGFDVDCACVAYDGKQVYAAPRALTAFMTQANTIDLTRRSPSYENRLSKYSHRGFEVHWPALERDRIDPTIFERSFGRTQGLARLLILEKLPKSVDRDAYMDQRRAERGRPAISRGYRNQFRNSGNIKDNEEDEVAEWVDQEEVASYHTMTVPYGQKYNASNINRLLYAKDLLLNAEWNKQKDREVHLHRHPCFFGTAQEVLEDCCGFCPIPTTDEELQIAAEESKTNVSGPLKFLIDDPGRQEIGSFNPITDDEWTTMAYVGDTARLCQAIVDNDLEHVQDWCSQEGVDVNRRDYTGRTPLHLATMVSSPEIVKCLIDHDARMIARLQDGRTALHIAAARGNVDMVRMLMDRSAANEEEEEAREEVRKAQRKAEREAAENKETRDDKPSTDTLKNEGSEESDEEDVSDEASEITLSSEESDSFTQGSFVKIEKEKQENQEAMLEDSDEDPDIFEVDVIAWDFGLSPLHLAILNGHQNIIDLLVSEYGADVLNPVKFVEPGTSTPKGVIMTIMLAFGLPTDKAKSVVKQLLELGATSAQGDTSSITAFHYTVSENQKEIFDVLLEHDRPIATSVLNNLCGDGARYGGGFITPLHTAIDKGHKEMVSKLLELGAKTTLDFDTWVKPFLAKNEYMKNSDTKDVKERWETDAMQPIVLAAGRSHGLIVEELLAHGADVNTLEKSAYTVMKNHDYIRYTVPQALLDIIRQKLKQLREYKEDEEREPETLKSMDDYLISYQKDSYSHWSVRKDVEWQLKDNTEKWKIYNERKAKGPAEGVKEKREAINNLIDELEHTEKVLLKAGARTFEDLHPKVPKYKEDDRYHYRRSSDSKVSFAPRVKFNAPDLNNAKEEAYTKMFEAAWAGDLETIKAFTLAQWKTSLPDYPDQMAPLKIAITDANGFSPFSIAVLRGHYEVAQKIIEICLTQYHKDDGVNSNVRWTMRGDQNDDEYYSEDDSEYDGRRGHDHLPIFSELVSDKFTVDNLGEVATMVKSDVLPLTMIEWDCKAARLLPSEDLENDTLASLLEYAVRANNTELFKFIMTLGAEQQTLLAKDEDDPRSYNVDVNIFRHAIRLGRTTMLGEMIKACGVGIPLSKLMKDSGVELKVKPKYYQGLSVGGKKRSDWAQNPHGQDYGVVEETLPPLLTAARFMNIDSLEWFSGTAPLRKYKEFAEVNKSDKRIKTLEQGLGFDKTIETWLNSNNELVFFAALTASYDDKSFPKYVSLLKHILSISPELLERKSSEGYSPLHAAVKIKKPLTVEFLIAQGANQRSRDKEGRNMLHTIIAPDPWGNNKAVKDIKLMLDLFDKKNIQEMAVERCSIQPGALTPLGLWLSANNGNHKSDDVISLLLEYTGGAELEMINGEGDLPLHVAVRNNLSTISKTLLRMNSALLYRENSTGRTPFEMARDIYISSLVSAPLTLSGNQYGSNWNQYQPGRDDYYGVTSRTPTDFLPKTGEEESANRTWEICKAVDESLGKEGKERTRRLVSLFEANEVARRVAGGKGKMRGVVVNGGLIDGEIKKDLVSDWICKSLCHLHCNPVHISSLIMNLSIFYRKD